MVPVVVKIEKADDEVIVLLQSEGSEYRWEIQDLDFWVPMVQLFLGRVFKRLGAKNFSIEIIEAISTAFKNGEKTATFTVF